MYFNGDGFGTVLVMFAVVCAVVGWAFIELILWLLSFVHVTIGG